ncbi:MAG: Kazal-type serine protease inhibitor [Candidatus Paceibacteria bacterium]
MFSGLKSFFRSGSFTKFILFLFAVALFLPSAVEAETAIFTNDAGGHYWDAAGNWSTGEVPDSNTDVVFDGSEYSGIVYITSGSQARSITMKGDFEGTVVMNDSLKVGVLEMKNGTFEVGSNPILITEGLALEGADAVYKAGSRSNTIGAIRAEKGKFKHQNALVEVKNGEVKFLDGTYDHGKEKLVLQGGDDLNIQDPLYELFINHQSISVLNSRLKVKKELVIKSGTLKGNNQKMIIDGNTKLIGPQAKYIAGGATQLFKDVNISAGKFVQGASSISASSGDWKQTGGEFVGSDIGNMISVNSFTLKSDAKFTAPKDGALGVAGDWYVEKSDNFNPNKGIVLFEYSGAKTIKKAANPFYDLEIDLNNKLVLKDGIVVKNDLIFGSGSSLDPKNNEIKIEGDWNPDNNSYSLVQKADFFEVEFGGGPSEFYPSGETFDDIKVDTRLDLKGNLKTLGSIDVQKGQVLDANNYQIDSPIVFFRGSSQIQNNTKLVSDATINQTSKVDLAELVVSNVIDIGGAFNSVEKIDFKYDTIINSSGNIGHKLIIDKNTTLTTEDSNKHDLNQLQFDGSTATEPSNVKSIAGKARFTLPAVGFDANQTVEVDVRVGKKYNNETKDIFVKKYNQGWVDSGKDCTISNSVCNFETKTLSEFVVGKKKDKQQQQTTPSIVGSHGLVINGGDQSTNNRDVTLKFSVKNVDKVAVSESKNFSNFSTIPQDDKMSYQLSSGEGQKTVYAKFKDSQGNSLTASDSIQLELKDQQQTKQKTKQDDKGQQTKQDQDNQQNQKQQDSQQQDQKQQDSQQQDQDYCLVVDSSIKLNFDDKSQAEQRKQSLSNQGRSVSLKSTNCDNVVISKSDSEDDQDKVVKIIKKGESGAKEGSKDGNRSQSSSVPGMSRSKLQQSCAMRYNPVCGVNGVSYINRCAARQANVRIEYSGKCSPEARSSCPLEKNKAYSAYNDNSVFYVTNKCKKRPFKRSDVYFSYFEGWQNVEPVPARKINAIPYSKLGFMPWGPRKKVLAGSLFKTVDSPKVYIKLGNGKKCWIKNERVFKELNYNFNQIIDIDESYLSTVPSCNSPISNTKTHPNYTLIKPRNSNTVYLVVPHPSKNKMQMLREVKNMRTLRDMGYDASQIVSVEPEEINRYDIGKTLTSSSIDSSGDIN